MNVVVLADAAEIGLAAADLFETVVRTTAGTPITIGLAAGATPAPTYVELVRRHTTGDLPFEQVEFVLLDEYVGLAADHPASFRRQIGEAFTDRVGVVASAVHSPRGDADDPAVAAREYEAVLAELPERELQLLGIGRNGHIGFNEPGSRFDSRSRVVELCPETRTDNRRHFPADRQVPTQAITMGIGTILDAKRVLLLATGAAKARAVAAALAGPIDESVPASALRLHPDVTVLLDPAAARELPSEFAVGPTSGG